MRRYLKLVLVISLGFGRLGVADDGDAYVLRYKPADGLYYLVERTFTLAKDKDFAHQEVCRQRAVIHYGKSTTTRAGLLKFTPQVHVLEESGKSRDLTGEFQPVNLRYPSGRWYDQWRWTTTIIERDCDMFPVFPEQAVRPGDTWHVRWPRQEVRGVMTQGEIIVAFKFEGFSEIDGVQCVKIAYQIEYAFEREQTPETDTWKTLVTARTASINGIAYFDHERGIAMTNEQHSSRTYKRSGVIGSEKVWKQKPESRRSIDDVYETEVWRRLISQEEAIRLIEAGKKPAPAAENAATNNLPLSRYLVTATNVSQPIYAVDPSKQQTYKRNAFVYFGEGAQKAGGQVPGQGNIVYLDNDGEPLSRETAPGGIYTSRMSEFTLTEFPLQAGYDFDLALDTFGQPFVLPVRPAQPLKEGLKWDTKLSVGLGFGEVILPVVVRHEVIGRQQQQARSCFVITYSVEGQWSLIREDGSGEAKVDVAGRGTVLYDPSADIIVEKRQEAVYTVGERKLRIEDGEKKWHADVQRQTSTVSVILQE